MISNKCNYALRALLELAKREGGGPATIVDIAQAQNIPARFLEAILRQLKQAGLTESVRGKKGGYVLAIPARTITIGQVIRLMEGPLIATETAQNGADGNMTDVFQEIWQEAAEALNQVYDSANFADLAERDRQAALKFVADYAI
jgi:Rrf2 family transcriptional regulator, cysteine metabolism repressor